MSAAHTPGPWRWTERPLTGRKVQILLGGTPERRIVTPDPRCVGPLGADTRLIAAAPDLLAACKTLLGDVERFQASGGKLTDAEEAHVQQMRDAVEKAEGRPA